FTVATSLASRTLVTKPEFCRCWTQPEQQPQSGSRWTVTIGASAADREATCKMEAAPAISTDRRVNVGSDFVMAKVLSILVPQVWGAAARAASRCRLQAFRSVIRMIATALLSLITCSLVPLLQVQA